MQDARGHQPPGQTSHSAQRPAQRMCAHSLGFDLEQELDRLCREDMWRRGDRNGKTLVKGPNLHVTLTALKAGACLCPHQTPGAVTIQMLRGRLDVSVRGEHVDMMAGDLLALDAGVQHSLHALDESAFLLTIGWPD